MKRYQTALLRWGWNRFCGEENLLALCEELLSRNGLTAGEARVRVTRTDMNLVITTNELKPDSRREGIRLGVSPYVQSSERALSGMKGVSYGDSIFSLREGQKRGLDEVLLFTEGDDSGFWSEGAWSNIFGVENGKLVTPPLSVGCLPGVTREVVIQLAKENGIEVEEETRTRKEVLQMDHLFVTSAGVGLAPVIEFESRKISEAPEIRFLASVLQGKRFCEK